MIKKRDTCLYCEEQMESETAKKKFCSDKCKVYWHRENPKVTLKNYNKQSTGTTKDYTKKAAENESIDTRKPFMSDIIKKKLGL